MRYTKQYKQELITKFKASGQSKNKFSKENNIGIATLHRWLEDETATFVKVETKQEIMSVNKSDIIKIEYGKFKIIVDSNTNEDLLCKVLKSMVSVC